jgi:ATP-dependent Clp protease ATP-binding subunit ClpC
MREELLAHLTAIFEEEVERLGDQRAALDQAARRFGDPRELTAQLQDTVPRWDRFARLDEVGSFRGPQESASGYAYRILSFAVAVCVISIVAASAIAFFFGREGELQLRLHVVLCMSVLQIPLTAGILMLANGMYRALYGMPSHRSWRMAVVYGLISMVFFPLLAFGWYWSLTGDLATSLVQLRFACYFAPLAPVLFALMSKQSVKKMRCHEEWTSLFL